MRRYRPAVYINCPYCDGEGGKWVNEDGEIYTQLQYRKLSEEMQKELIFDECPHCEGDGIMLFDPEDIEPEFDDK